MLPFATHELCKRKESLKQVVFLFCGARSLSSVCRGAKGRVIVSCFAGLHSLPISYYRGTKILVLRPTSRTMKRWNITEDTCLISSLLLNRYSVLGHGAHEHCGQKLLLSHQILTQTFIHWMHSPRAHYK